MKVPFLPLLAIIFGGSLALAQYSTSGKLSAVNDYSSKGFRVALIKPILDIEGKLSYKSFSVSDSSKIDDASGFSLGYAHLPIQSLGWTSNLSYMELKNDNSYEGLARLDANLAFAFNEIINIKGGINLSKFTRNALQEMDPGLGFQAGVGLQVTRTFGIDVSYVDMNQKISKNNLAAELKEKGPEISLNATF